MRERSSWINGLIWTACAVGLTTLMGCAGSNGSTGAGASGGDGGSGAQGGDGGAQTTTGTGGTTSTASTGGAGGGTGGAGGTGGMVTTGGGGTGGTGGVMSTDPCDGASDGKHCGGELGGLADHNSVYTCGGGTTSSVTPCPNGCNNGNCIQPPSDPCMNANAGNGAYCGASLGAGDPNTLYQCQNKVTASSMVCPNGCKVQPPGVADSCNPSGDPCANATSGNGLYCGGGINGDPNVLYNCQNGSTASSTTCSAGCQVMPPGTPDACAPTGGGQCCLNKPPGVLTQAYSACGGGGVHYGIDYGTPVGTPIYAGMSGTVVASALGFPNCYNNGCTSTCWNSFNYVKLKADCGDPNQSGNDFYIYYLHIDSMAAGISNGSHVDQGQLLAKSGNSGCSSGPHIHIETVSVPVGQSAKLNTCSSQNPAAHYCQ